MDTAEKTEESSLEHVKVPTRAVLMAGGRGTRLAPLTSVLPKPLMPLGEEPILGLLLRQLASQGVSDVTLAIGYLGDLVEAYCGDGSRFGVNLTYSREDVPLGTIGPLRNIEGLDTPFLVMNGDLLTTLGYRDLLNSHVASEAMLTLSAIRRTIQFEFGVLETERRGANTVVSQMLEKPGLERWVSMGAYVLDPSVIDLIPEGRPYDLPSLVSDLLAAGQAVGAYEFDGYWLDIGRHGDYQQALDDFEEMRPLFFGEPEPAQREAAAAQETHS